MADEVPVCDVLCEAMEYLSKLGANLRSRSENLKEKRISKEKLKNSHAVHKAASKVLLICELSKKSLDNVETGVRKVLSHIDKSRSVASTSIGAKSSDSGSERKPVHFIEYKSRKLRIATKVSLKHYMSVKVRAQRMSTSVQNKYPVYHDCKLYRSRIRAQKSKNDVVERRKDSSDKEHEQPTYDANNEKDKSNDRVKECEQIDKDEGHETINKVSDGSQNLIIPKSKHTNDDKTEIKTSESTDKKKNSSSDRQSEEKEGKSKKYKNGLDDTSKLNNHTDNKTDDNRSSKTESKPVDDNKSSKTESKPFGDIEESANVKKKLVDDSSKMKTTREKSVENSNENAPEKNKERIIDQGKSDSNEQLIAQRKKVRHVVVSSSDSEEELTKRKLQKNKSRDIKENDKSLDISNSKQNTREMKCDKNEKSQKNSDSENSSNDINMEDSKPLIRCVNISKLLKPDVVDKVSSKSPVKNKLADKKIKQNNITKIESKSKASVNHKKEEDFWSQKRKEVQNFKPKGFTIDITRLPRFSAPYLKSYGLLRVVQNGEIIFDLESAESIKNMQPSHESISKVKTALLNDSEDSDENMASPILSKKARKAPNKPHTENNKSIKKSDSNSEERQNNVNGSISDENVTSNKSLDVQEIVQDSCLNKQNSDKNKEFDINERDDDIQGDNASAGYKESEKQNSESNNENVLDCQVSSREQDNKIVHNGKKHSDDNVNCNKDNETDKNDPDKIKESLLLDSDSDKNEEPTEEHTAESNNKSPLQDKKSNHANEDPDKIKNALLLDSDSDKNEESGNLVKAKCPIDDLEELAKKVSDIIKKNLLDDSDSEKSDTEKSEKTIASKDVEMGSKSNDTCRISEKGIVDDDKKAENQKECSESEPTPVKIQKIKSSLLNESSDSLSDSGSNKRKELQAKNTAKKKLLDYSSSSDVDKELKSSSEDDVAVRHKRKRKRRLRQPSRRSSSSSEDIVRKKLKCGSKSPENTNSRGSPGLDEGNKDDQSNSSSRKMVRSKAKPSGSSGQSSDNQDASDKDIDGLTNLNNLNKPRRRDSSPGNEQSTTVRRSSRPKAKSSIGEEYLQAQSSSDDEVIDDNDIEDLPTVKMPELNGGAIEHLAKHDLLEDSDSSVSNAEVKAENMDSDEDHKVKSKRRKPQAISSDSEGGTSRKKDKEFKLSDFEESGEDSSVEPSSKSKRKKKGSDSDASGNSSDGGHKKRRRIKQVNDSDGSGSDTENEGRNKHGRKNIRKVMGKNQLEEATKKAAREEKERMARIIERQKLYNNLEFDESGKPDEVVLDKVVLDFDPETKEPLIEVDRGLVKKLKPHQANGIKFMWDACFESVKRIKKDRGSGCILAHCMGLGKTLQVVSLTHTLLIHGKLTGTNRVLVVCPLSTVLNWVNEFRMWLKHAHTEYDVDVYELSRFKQNSERAFQLQQWFDHGGVCVLGYEMFRNLSADNNKKFKKKMLKSFQESLVDPGPDLVVCDEGHLLKNEKTSLSQSMNRVKTRRRIVLTGTPLQNNLKEYYCMVQFVKPNLLGKYNEYLNRFVNPITNGQYTDSTEHDIKIMKRRSHVLHKMLDGAVQRRDYGVLAPFLPPKHEFVLFITLSDIQTRLYQHYLDNYSRRPLPGKSSGFLFPDFQSLQRIWTHPLVLKYNSERYEIMQQKKREREEEDSEGSLVDFIDDDSTPDESSTEESSDDLSEMSDDSRKKSKKKKAPKKSKAKESKANSRRGTRANPVELLEDDPVDDIMEVKNDNPTEWWIPLVEEDELEDMRNSSKLVLLFDILRQCEAIGDKLLVFSQSLYSLDLIEHFLGKVDEATQEGRIDEKLGGHVGSWSPGIDYFRLDGSTSCENRSIWCKNFNREDNPRARLFLISTRAGGLGINLVAANRVVIFDVSWNPSHDVQSIFRVYRFGQKKPCYIYRFLAMGTMEEKIYERQVTKQAISKRVIDEQQIDRHYAENDLAELYKFEPTPPTPRPVPSLPKDRLFAEMLKDHEAQIYKFHEHDSLLENKEEETLSEEERKAAWDDFENEKNRPPPAPFVSPWPMHNGMMPTLLAQQQQQLAYAALAAMLRKDMPNINDNQIRDMLPLIYNSNPGMFGGFDYGLMQKMSEIYKYAQPGLMNPMMSPAMNAGGGAGGAGGAGAGGTSGLQYSPPWQRQQQQQHQMRLQQLMQHQNQMGAKLYAGGLGSRDPVAMALQQQRAREIMMGGGGGGAGAGAGRPRGRPPLQPRAPPAHAALPPSQDVVNLDSD